jgi:hypothetical protein
MESRNNRKVKRSKVSVACNNCRRRKIRCDGGQPCCNKCAFRKIKCVYTRTQNMESEYVKMLEDKVREFSQKKSDGAEQTLIDGSRTHTPGALNSNYNGVCVGDHTSHPGQSEPLGIDPGTDSTTVSALNLISHSSFYGMSSSVSFIRLVEAAVLERNG